VKKVPYIKYAEEIDKNQNFVVVKSASVGDNKLNKIKNKVSKMLNPAASNPYKVGQFQQSILPRIIDDDDYLDQNIKNNMINNQKSLNVVSSFS
jgi:hypothetical protein